MRVSSVISNVSGCNGTLKSTRIKARFPEKLYCSMVCIANKFGAKVINFFAAGKVLGSMFRVRYTKFKRDEDPNQLSHFDEPLKDKDHKHQMSSFIEARTDIDCIYNRPSLLISAKPI
jgi:hypothetical protein